MRGKTTFPLATRGLLQVLAVLWLALPMFIWSCGKSTSRPGDNDQTGDQDQLGDEDNPGDLDTDGVDTDQVELPDQDQDKDKVDEDADIPGDQDLPDGDQNDVPTDEDLVDGQDQPTDEDVVDGQDQDEPGDQDQTDQTEGDQEQVGGLNLIFLRFVTAGGSAVSESFRLHGARIEAIPAGAAASEHFRLNQAVIQPR